MKKASNQMVRDEYGYFSKAEQRIINNIETENKQFKSNSVCNDFKVKIGEIIKSKENGNESNI